MLDGFTRWAIGFIINQLTNAFNGLVWRMSVPFWRTVYLFALKQIPVRFYIVMVRRLPIRSFDAYDEHPLEHGAVGVQL